MWLCRNKFIFENIFIPHVVFKEAVDSLKDFRRYNRREEELVNLCGDSSYIILLTGWQLPSSGIIKMNWDASMNVTRRYIRIVIVDRDY
jgi:hypothetical protein